MQGSHLIQYAVPSGASNLTLSEGQFVGRPITLMRVPERMALLSRWMVLTQARTFCFATIINDSTTVGDLGATLYHINEPATSVKFTASTRFLSPSAVFHYLASGRERQSLPMGDSYLAPAGRLLPFCSRMPTHWSPSGNQNCLPRRAGLLGRAK